MPHDASARRSFSGPRAPLARTGGLNASWVGVACSRAPLARTGATPVDGTRRVLVRSAHVENGFRTTGPCPSASARGSARRRAGSARWRNSSCTPSPRRATTPVKPRCSGGRPTGSGRRSARRKGESQQSGSRGVVHEGRASARRSDRERAQRGGLRRRAPGCRAAPPHDSTRRCGKRAKPCPTTGPHRAPRSGLRRRAGGGARVRRREERARLHDREAHRGAGRARAAHRAIGAPSQHAGRARLPDHGVRRDVRDEHRARVRDGLRALALLGGADRVVSRRLCHPSRRRPEARRRRGPVPTGDGHRGAARDAARAPKPW